MKCPLIVYQMLSPVYPNSVVTARTKRSICREKSQYSFRGKCSFQLSSLSRRDWTLSSSSSPTLPCPTAQTESCVVSLQMWPMESEHRLTRRTKEILFHLVKALGVYTWTINTNITGLVDKCSSILFTESVQRSTKIEAKHTNKLHRILPGALQFKNDNVS